MLTPELLIRNTLHEERQRIADWIQSLPICPGHKAYVVKAIRDGRYMQLQIQAQQEEAEEKDK